MICVDFKGLKWILTWTFSDCILSGVETHRRGFRRLRRRRELSKCIERANYCTNTRARRASGERARNGIGGGDDCDSADSYEKYCKILFFFSSYINRLSVGPTSNRRTK